MDILDAGGPATGCRDAHTGRAQPLACSVSETRRPMKPEPPRMRTFNCYASTGAGEVLSTRKAVREAVREATCRANRNAMATMVNVGLAWLLVANTALPAMKRLLTP